MESSVAEFEVIRPKRLVIVEPIVMMAALFGFPLMLITQLFILERITQDLNVTRSNVSFDICKVNSTDPDYILNQKVQSDASYFGLISSIVSCVPALFVCIFLGAYSDKAGRKYAILPPLIAGVVKTIITVLVVMLDWPIWCLLVGSFLDGLGGYFTTLLMGCFAYIADTTTKEQRRFRITVCEMCLFLSAFIGPLGAGKILETIGYLYSFLITLGGQIILLIYSIFFVPETVQRDTNARFFDKNHVKRLVKVLTVKDVVSNRSFKLKILLLAFFFSTVSSFEGIETIYLANRPLCMGPAMIGYYQSAYIGGSTLLAIVVAWLTKYCMTDQGVALIAGIGGIGKNLYIAFIQSEFLIFITPVFGMFSFLYTPTIRTLMSNMVSSSEQGAVFGTIAFVEVVCSLVGVAIFNPIYSATQNFMTGFVFITIAISYFMGCVVLLVYIIKVWRESRGRPYDLLVQSHDDANESPGNGAQVGSTGDHDNGITNTAEISADSHGYSSGDTGRME